MYEGGECVGGVYDYVSMRYLTMHTLMRTPATSQTPSSPAMPTYRHLQPARSILTTYVCAVLCFDEGDEVDEGDGNGKAGEANAGDGNDKADEGDEGDDEAPNA